MENKGLKLYVRMLNEAKAIESTEVAVIIAVVVLVAYAAYALLGGKISEVVTDVAGRI
jgi:Flp pilus assembly pilin Flp